MKHTPTIYLHTTWSGWTWDYDTPDDVFHANVTIEHRCSVHHVTVMRDTYDGCFWGGSKDLGDAITMMVDECESGDADVA